MTKGKKSWRTDRKKSQWRREIHEEIREGDSTFDYREMLLTAQKMRSPKLTCNLDKHILNLVYLISTRSRESEILDAALIWILIFTPIIIN